MTIEEYCGEAMTIEEYREHCRELAEQAERDAGRADRQAERSFWHGYAQAMRAVVADMPESGDAGKL